MMLLYFLLTVLNIFMYLYGFFPISSNTSHTIIKPPTKIEDVNLNSKKVYIPHFDKVVLMIIDAMRTDFVKPDTMPFISERIKEKGCIMNVKVESPTVTLPRIKSLTTGSVPQFIDIILNLGNSHALDDSLLHILHKNNKTIVFYGDDTWLKLFPNIFVRSEGTTSFYVNDFHEVDNNVTRNVRKEVGRKDWNMMILHYLGLDHIGHVFGPRSELVPKKLKEMDHIVEFIHNEISDHSRTLILVTGDHGMKDSGGHGGSTFGETNVPLVLLGTDCSKAPISQTDIPANLAALLGIEIPSTSIGSIQKNLLEALTVEQYLYALRYNTLVLLTKRKIFDDHFELASKYHAIYAKNKDEVLARKAADLYENCSKSIHDLLTKTSTHQNVELMMIAIMNFCYIFFEVTNIILSETPFKILSVSTILLVNILYHVTHYFVLFIVIMNILIIPKVLSLLTYLLISSYKIRFEYFFLLIMTLVQPFTLLSSSFIEEEHQYWYFISTTFIYLCFINSLKFKNLYSLAWLGLLILFKFSRNMNQTGDKWASLPDSADWFLEKDNQSYLTLFYIACIITIFIINIKLLNKMNSFIILLNVLTVSLLMGNYFIESRRLIIQRSIWFLVLIQTLMSCFHKYSIVSAWILICMLLSKPFNLILLILCIAASNLFLQKNKNTEVATIFHLWLGKTLFFMQGHSNSIASVNVSSGYVGLNSYIPLIVVLQVLCHTYAFPILSHLLLLKRNFIDKNKMYSILFLHELLTVIVYFIVALLHRQHIFIWSVFAPKLLVEGSHCVILFVEILIFFIFDLCQNCRIKLVN